MDIQDKSLNIIFLGGIDDKLWINNGKRLSKNYRQGYRVYSINGISNSLMSQPIGGLGGYSCLYVTK